jgi:hypothetical protein
MARTKAERNAAALETAKQRRAEFKSQIFQIESANTTREAYAEREERIRQAMRAANLDPIEKL